MRNQRIQKVDQLWFRKKLVALAVQYAYGYKWWSEYPLYYLATEKIYYHNSKRPRMLRSPPTWPALKYRINLSHFTFGAFCKLMRRWNRAFWRNCRYKGTAWCPFSPLKPRKFTTITSDSDYLPNRPQNQIIFRRRGKQRTLVISW